MISGSSALTRAARLDVHLDDRHVLEVADVGDRSISIGPSFRGLSRSEHQPAHVLEDVAEVAGEAGGERAVDDPMVVGDESGSISRGWNSLPFQTGAIFERTTPRIATSGALTIGVKSVPPMPPRLEIVKEPPCMSAGAELAVARLLRERAELLAELVDALAVDVLDHRHDQAVRRVDRDADVVVLLEDQASFSGESEVLNSGNSFSAETLAFIRKASSVTR